MSSFSVGKILKDMPPTPKTTLLILEDIVSLVASIPLALIHFASSSAGSQSPEERDLREAPLLELNVSLSLILHIFCFWWSLNLFS